MYMPPQYVISSACMLFRVYFSSCIFLFACMSLHLHSPSYVCPYRVWAFMCSYPPYTYICPSVNMSRPCICPVHVYVRFVCIFLCWLFLHVYVAYGCICSVCIFLPCVCRLCMPLHEYVPSVFAYVTSVVGVRSVGFTHRLTPIGSLGYIFFFYQFCACIVVILSSVDCPSFLIHSIIFLGK